MEISIKIAQNIATFSIEWDMFLPSQHHLKSINLQAFENSHIDDIDNNYVQVFLKEKLIGILYLQQFNFAHQHLNFGKRNSFFISALKLFLPIKLSILVCGQLFRINYQGFYFKDPAHNPLVLEAINLFIQQQETCQPCGIMIKDCSEVFIEQNSRHFGYQFFNGDVTMEINRRAHWLTFNDYLTDLNKKYRKRANKILQSFSAIDKQLLTADQILEQATAIEKLYWNVVQKQAVKLGTVNIQYFYELKTSVGNNFEFHALYLHGKMVGFYTFIFYETTMETHYIGLDYETNKTANIYFNILFEGIKTMVERQYNSLELGRTAKEAKISAGALPKQIINYIRIKNPVIKFAVNYFLNRFNKKENQFTINRNPLK